MSYTGFTTTLQYFSINNTEDNMHKPQKQSSNHFVNKEAGQAIIKLRRKLSTAYSKSDYKTTREIEAISQELDRHIADEQRARVNKIMPKVL